ncbi:MAG: hypothetical protein ACLGH0_00135, partial [Thermoanaerobaculia bacterium]
DLTYAPGIGCDSTDCLIAWSTTAGDIYAMILDGTVLAPFPLATSARLEAQPHVVAMRDGRFVVLYTSGGIGDSMLATRIVTMGEDVPGRRRAVR